MFEKFKSAAEAAGNTEVRRFGTEAEALSFIEGFLKKEGTQDVAGSYAVWADSTLLAGAETKALVDRIPGLKLEITRDLAKKAKIGITQMDWGLADTGTLAQDATAPAQRLASALPWIHVALLRTDRIVANLPALMTKMHPATCPYLSLITGPSKTADIERVLAIGVHGPERLVIVCMDGRGDVRHE